ncbi:hypothetical protein COMA2_170038 [Candidatus Nitrospira nitrificans]|uniref:Uncharacterized protein n=1 Tax=Candidatus Nitrospira nitrificans TaxID=1742973 RepID=A0A0S4L9X2_9BACT|nr:hypothetical protein COMA2_170038 [Candidatus Nitrospira nitrificans]
MILPFVNLLEGKGYSESICLLTRLVKTHPGYSGVAGARTRDHIVKTRESVAKSRKRVNEKNARLAWRNACTTPCG